MLVKRLFKSKMCFDNGWRQRLNLSAEIHKDKEKIVVVTVEQSSMGKYIEKRVCKDIKEAYFVAEEHTA